MTIQIKKSKKPVKYSFAIKKMEQRLNDLSNENANELIWILEHEEVFTGGTSYNEKEILDKSINFIKTNRGGKITYHGPGQLIFYIVLDLKNRGKNIKKLIFAIEKTIIDTLKEFNIPTFADRKNVGIWYQNNNKTEKIGAIGIKVKKWIAYHGFAINISNDLKQYKKIIPCGITDKEITRLIDIKKQNYTNIKNKLVKNFLLNI